MILSDSTIREQLKKGRLIIDPEPYDFQIQPASVDLHLAGQFLSPYSDDPPMVRTSILIAPGECLLGTTSERVTIPDDVVARVEGKSSWGRKFLLCHSTAGFIDPGFSGQITLELVNLSAVNQILEAGTLIAQLSFHWLDLPAARPYGSEGLNSHYQNQVGVTPSAEPWT